MRHREPGSRARGFTLLEILVVVVIIGVMASFAVLSIGNRSLDDRLDLEARRLEQLMILAADDAVLQGAELGFLRTSDGYAFLSLRAEKDAEGRPVRRWRALDESTPLRPRRLESPYELSLRVEGRDTGPSALTSADPEQEMKPQVLLLSSGETSEFELILGARGYGVRYALTGDAAGTFKLVRREAAS